MGVALTLMAGLAYACVDWYGDGQISAVNDGNGGGGDPAASGVFTGTGNGADMNYCDSGTTFPGYEFSDAAQADGGDTITVSVATGSGACNGAGNKLNQGNNSILLRNSTAFSRITVGGTPAWSMINGQGCWAGVSIRTLGTFSVNSSGNANGTFTLPSPLTTANGASNSSLLCVGQDPAIGATKAIFIPIQIEATA